MKVTLLDRCATCGRTFLEGEDVMRYRVSRSPGEWVDEAEHVACNNERSDFTCGSTFGQQRKIMHN